MSDSRWIKIRRQNAERACGVAMQLANELMQPANAPASLQILLARARAEAVEALLGLASVAPTDSNSIMALQARVAMFDDLVRFIVEAMNEGDEGLRIIKEEDREEIGALAYPPAAEGDSYEQYDDS